jgi:hypothetical protein
MPPTFPFLYQKYKEEQSNKIFEKNYTKKAIVCQRNIGARSWVYFEGFSAGIRGIFGVEVERGRFQRFAEVRQAFLRLIGAHRFLPPRIPVLYDWM